MIQITKVVTRNFILDFVAKIQNLFGMNLKVYEDMVAKGHAQIKQELIDKKINLRWYQIVITQLQNGAIVLMLYGEEI